MKRKIILVLTCCLCVSGSVDAKGGRFWNAIKKTVGGVLKAASVVAVERAYVHGGYSKEEAAERTKDFCEAVMENDANVQRGLAYIKAEDKYARQRVVKDYAFDFAADVSSNPNVINKMRTLTDGNLYYLQEKSNAKTDADLQAARDSLVRVYFDVGYDTYQEAKSRRAKYLAERLALKKELISRGQNPDFAEELAGSIIAIRNNPSLTDGEKESYYKAYGLFDDTQVREMKKVVEEVVADNYVHSDPAEEVLKQKALQAQKEIERQKKVEEELKRQKEIEAKNNAIKLIDETVVGNFLFDQVALSDDQKTQIKEVAELLVKYDDIAIDLVGHTCKKGYKSVNKRVGLKRANAVKAYLLENGVNEERVSTDSKGESEPQIVNPTLKERKINRRVEFNVQ